MPILKLEQPDEMKEIRFELDYHQSLTLQDRFRMLEERKKAFLEELIRHGHRKSFEIVKRA